MKKSLLLYIICLIVLFASWNVSAADPNPDVKKLQRSLIELGYDPGPANGMLGPKTTTAIDAFQRDNKRTVDGKISRLLLIAVERRVNTARQEATPEGQREKRERERLLGLSNEELAQRFRKASEKDAERMFYLIKERSLELPVSALEKFGFGSFLVSFHLASLFYPDSIEGVKQFQADIGVKETGQLTLGQFFRLRYRWTHSRENHVHVSTLPIEISVIDKAYATVEGTWVIENDEIAYPINFAKIICRRDRKECQDITANLQIPDLDEADAAKGKDASDNYHLHLSENTYDIISWDANEIVARNQNILGCSISLLTLNLNSHEVWEMTRNNETPECRRSTPLFGTLDKPRVARLVPGFDAAWEFWQKRRVITDSYFNPRFREKAKSAAKKAYPDWFKEPPSAQ